ncbi:MAG: D-alanyl-D-alanine carboxypeptidase family protein [Lachnospiraceae bacterium]
MRYKKYKIRKIIAVCLCTAMVLPVSGCHSSEKITDAYHVNSSIFGLIRNQEERIPESHLMASDLCIANENTENENVDMSLAVGAGVFNLDTLETIYAKNVHEKLYPASTTKVLTAYVVIKYGNPDDTVTITSEHLELETGSSICGLQEGDTLTVEQLLYGLIICSGNDAANALADYLCGSSEKFAEMMNEEARLLGATNSHFVNPHGLHDEDHYTTVYDLYLIFRAALSYELFRDIIGTTSYIAEYTSADGETVTAGWNHSMYYFSGKYMPPDGVTVLGGKTGTTTSALSCLVLLAENETGEECIAIILKSRDRGVLYEEMNDLLDEINK